ARTSFACWGRRGGTEGPARHHGPRRIRFSPSVELLEHRLVPAVNTITGSGAAALGDSATITPLSGGAGTDAAGQLRHGVAGAEGLTGSTEIIFASSLFNSGPQTIHLSVIGDTSFGPSALQITSNADITITGPTGIGTNGSNGLTISPTTNTMRLFEVASG